MSSEILYGRKCRILVGDANGEAYEVSSLRCTFSVEKIALATQNYAEVKIYNLNQETESKIVKEGQQLIIEAGYSAFKDVKGQYIYDQYGIIFDGTIVQTIRTREDNIDYVLTIVGLDGDGFINGSVVSFTLKSGQDPRSIMKHIAGNATTPTEIGRISDDIPSTKLPRGKVLFGEPEKYMREIAKGNNATFYIDDGKIYIRKATDVSEGEALVLTPETGLVGTPQQTEEGITFQCLLNSKIKLHTMVKIDNSYIQEMKRIIGEYRIMLDESGQYEAYKINHYGDTRGNDWYTEVVGLSRDGLIPYLLKNFAQSPW